MYIAFILIIAAGCSNNKAYNPLVGFWYLENNPNVTVSLNSEGGFIIGEYADKYYAEGTYSADNHNVYFYVKKIHIDSMTYTNEYGDHAIIEYKINIDSTNNATYIQFFTKNSIANEYIRWIELYLGGGPYKKDSRNIFYVEY